MVANLFPRNGLRICGPLLAGLVLAGCGGGFDPNGVVESRPVRLDGEQVVLDLGQVECGAREDLWTISRLDESRSVGRLTQKGRDLQFSDDVQIGDPGIGVPYVQIHGSFPVKVMRMGTILDEDGYTKLANARAGVKIAHSCFPNPLTLMGIRHGQFDQSTPPIFRLKLDADWHVDQVIH